MQDFDVHLLYMITFIKEEAVFVMATVILILSGIGISNLNHGPEEEDPINTTAPAQQAVSSLTTQSSAPAPTPAVPTQTREGGQNES